MRSRLHLRKATERDLPLIQRLLKSSNLPFEDIPQRVISLFVGYADSKVVGIGGVEVPGSFGLLRSVAIEESLRGKGYGRALVDRILEIANAKGIKELHLLTTTAGAFFSQIGFERTKREDAPAELQNTTEFKELCPISSICMRKRISQKSKQ